MALGGIDASSAAANDFLNPERRIAFFIADVTNVAAIGRKPCLGTVELTKGQREWRGTLYSGQPELLPLAAMITAEQNPAAIGRDLRLRAPRSFFTEDFFQIFGRVDCY